MQVTAAVLRLLVFPGLFFAVPMAWFFLYVERKTIACMQQRIGPPLLQPFYDFVKLLGKESPGHPGIEGLLMKAWPALSVAALLAALSLLPVFPVKSGFSGDLILLITLLELPSMFYILAGFTSRSIYGKVGAMREASLSLSSNLLFLVAVMMIAVSEHTFRLSELAAPTHSPARWLGLAAILLCIPAKLRLNPFSVSSAEQEIYSGPLTEYSGGDLALWELAHGLEWLAITGLVVSLAFPRTGFRLADAGIFTFFCCILVVLLATVAAATARFTIERSVRFYWRWSVALAVVFLVTAVLIPRLVP
jgi:NADH-quinone oxidoreductase subunit H